jgi:hypothetical protein
MGKLREGLTDLAAQVLAVAPPAWGLWYFLGSIGAGVRFMPLWMGIAGALVVYRMAKR